MNRDGRDGGGQAVGTRDRAPFRAPDRGVATGIGVDAGRLHRPPPAVTLKPTVALATGLLSPSVTATQEAWRLECRARRSAIAGQRRYHRGGAGGQIDCPRGHPGQPGRANAGSGTDSSAKASPLNVASPRPRYSPWWTGQAAPPLAIPRHRQPPLRHGGPGHPAAAPPVPASGSCRSAPGREADGERSLVVCAGGGSMFFRPRSRRGARAPRRMGNRRAPRGSRGRGEFGKGK